MLNHFTSCRIRVICLPDVDKPIGGVKQLFKHVEHLVALGLDAAMVTESPNFHPSWFTSKAPVKSFQQCIDDSDFKSSSTIIVLPETYIGLDLTSFRGVNLLDIKRVIFNQNAYYTFGSSLASLDKIREFYFHHNVLHTLCVSSDSYRFLSSCLSIPADRLSRIVNAVESYFTSATNKSNIFSFMPRKNPDHVHSVIASLQLSSFNFSESWQGQPLSDLSHHDIALYLSKSRLFLSFGHPEGFGLPVAEAMASSCWVIGYSGLGGSELFSFNGCSHIEFGDWSTFVEQIRTTIDRFYHHPYETKLILDHQAEAVKSIYSLHHELSSIEHAWGLILNHFSVSKTL